LNIVHIVDGVFLNCWPPVILRMRLDYCCRLHGTAQLRCTL